MTDTQLAILAAAAMFAQDILGTIMVQFENVALDLAKTPNVFKAGWLIKKGELVLKDYLRASWRSWVAPWMDQLMWTVGITTTTIAVNAFGGHDQGKKILVFSLVSAANLIGTKVGQNLGRSILRRKSTPTVDQRLTVIEKRLGLLP